MRGATRENGPIIIMSPISTHTPHAGRDCLSHHFQLPFLISTHTPLARRDAFAETHSRKPENFYSHASCEARPQHDRGAGEYPKFLLTRLLRGATGPGILIMSDPPFLLTRLLRGATCFLRVFVQALQFLLTRLLRGATLASR